MESLSHRHHAIAEWLVANPHRTQRECARELGYTEAWLSRIISSDMFQAYYQQLCRERQVEAIHTVANKMAAAANLALDRLIERLQNKPSDRLVLETADKMLEKLGYSVPDRQVHLHLTAEDIERARRRARELIYGSQEAS